MQPRSQGSLARRGRVGENPENEVAYNGGQKPVKRTWGLCEDTFLSNCYIGSCS